PSGSIAARRTSLVTVARTAAVKSASRHLALDGSSFRVDLRSRSFRSLAVTQRVSCITLSPGCHRRRMGGRREPSVVTNVKTALVGQLQPVELRIRLLGPMTVTVDGRPVTIAAKKARALLGYLALREGAEVARGVITGLLWGERSESQARASLRQTL